MNYGKPKIALLVSAALCLASCSGSTSLNAEQNRPEAKDSPDQATASVSASSSATTAIAEAPLAIAPHVPLVFSGGNVVSFTSLGGLRLTLPDGVESYAEADLVALRTAEAPGAEVVISRIFEAGIIQVPSIEQVVAELQKRFEVETNETSDTLDFLGRTLTKHEVRGPADLGNPDFFSSRPTQFESIYRWSPLPNADMFLAEVPGGVLAVAAVGDSLEAIAGGLDLVNFVAPSAELLTPDGEMRVAAIDERRIQKLGENSVFVPPAEDPAGPAVLTTQFAAIEPGKFQSINVRPRLELDIPAGWFASPNEPARVTLTDGAARGPGDHVVIMISGPRSVAGTILNRVWGSPAVDVTDIRRFLADGSDRHPNFQIRNVDLEAEIGGMSAVSFDARIKPDATCQLEDPCEFRIAGSGGDTTMEIMPGNAYRIWWVEHPDHPSLVISAGVPAANAGWIDGRAAEVLSSFRFFPAE